MSIVVVPPRWTSGSVFSFGNHSNKHHHLFHGIAWLLSDRSNIISEMNDEQVSVINDMIDELERIEHGVIIENAQKRTKRRAKVLNARPLKENDENLKAAYHVAMLNRQASVDEMSYDTFKLLYDDITAILRENKK